MYELLAFMVNFFTACAKAWTSLFYSDDKTLYRLTCIQVSINYNEGESSTTIFLIFLFWTLLNSFPLVIYLNNTICGIFYIMKFKGHILSNLQVACI